MTYSKLITDINLQSGLPQSTVDGVFRALAREVECALSEGRRITLPNIGTFSAQPRAARAGRNPKTGEAIEIPAKTTVKFKASQKLLGQLPPPSTEG